MKSYFGKVALVTGGASGIGLGLATALGRAGARVALASTNADKLATASAKLGGEGIIATTLQLNVADAAQWPNAVDHVSHVLGPIDFLALNAGVAPVPLTLEQIPVEQWDWSLSVNLMGVAHGLRACLPAMRNRGSEGHVLITSSIAGVGAGARMGSYATPKAGLITLAQILRAELLGTPIGVSVLIPAAVRTGIAATSAKYSPNKAAAAYQGIAQMLSGGLDPCAVGEFTLQRISAGQFFIFTHKSHREDIEIRFAELLSAFDYTLI